jgi:HAD superfamily hydrolase (TIGR01549 family)
MRERNLRGIATFVQTGAGFKAPAVAISDALSAKGVEMEKLDFFPAIGSPRIDTIWRKLWQYMLTTSPRLHDLTLKGESRLFVGFLRWLHLMLIEEKMVRWLEEQQPDFIISGHFAPTYLLSYVVKKYNLDIPIFGYNSEVLSTHLADVIPEVEGHFVATAQGYRAMRGLGQPEETIIHSSFPLAAKYNKQYGSIGEERRRLELDPEAFTVLFTFGGEGIGHTALIEKLAAAQLPVQIVAICGWSEETRAKIEEIHERYPEARIHPLGFVSNMPDYLYCCDLSAGKSGMNLTFESIYMRKPFLVTMAMANEKVTARFITDHGFGWHPQSVDEQFEIIANCIKDPDYARPVRENLAAHGIDFDTGKIADHILGRVERRKKLALRSRPVLYLDLAGTLCDIPISGQWERVNLEGIGNVFEYLELPQHTDHHVVEELSRSFVERKSELRAAAKQELREYPIREQLANFLRETAAQRPELERTLNPENLSPSDWDRLEYLFIKPELEITVPFEEARQTVEELSRYYHLYLLSNNVSRTLVTEISAKVGVTRYFKRIFVSADCGFRKPHRSFFDHVTATTGIDPAKCVMIGDRLNQDIKLARDFDLKSIYIHAVDHDDNVGAEGYSYDMCVGSLSELSDLLCS